jgi:uncharacterized membrane protein YciS (DUF1049 family)
MFGVKVFKYLLKIPALIFLVAFVVLNRQETTLYISPMTDPLVLPLWIMGLILFIIGFTVGALLLWLNSWPIRKDLRQTKKDLKVTQDKYEELATLKDDAELLTSSQSIETIDYDAK